MALPIRDPEATKIFNVAGFLKHEAERSAALYELAYECWQAGYKRSKCMELATALYSDVSEKEWVVMFKHMFDEQLSGYTNVTE